MSSSYRTKPRSTAALDAMTVAPAHGSHTRLQVCVVVWTHLSSTLEAFLAELVPFIRSFSIDFSDFDAQTRNNPSRPLREIWSGASISGGKGPPSLVSKHPPSALCHLTLSYLVATVFKVTFICVSTPEAHVLDIHISTTTTIPLHRL